MIRDLSKALPRTLCFAALVAVLAALWVGWRVAAEGYPVLLVDDLRRLLHRTLLATVVGLVVCEGVAWVLRKVLPKLGERWTGLLALAVAATPWGLLAAYHWNRSHSIRPSQLFQPYALGVNLKLALALGVLFAALAWALPHWRRATRQKAWLGALAALLLVVEASHFGLTRPPAEGKDKIDVLVILVDALRADHLGAAGYGRDTSPAIDALSRDSILFEQAIAQSTFTKSSIASLFTGRNPYQHGLYWGSHQESPGAITSDLLSLDETTLAESFRQRDFLTVGWVQNSHLLDFMGFGQGFVRYRHQQGSVERISEHYLRFLKSGAQRHPYFAYLHYIDLHDPYLPEAPYDALFTEPTDVYADIDLANWGTYLEAVRQGEIVPTDEQVSQFRAYYDGLIRKVDDYLAKLVAELKAQGLYDRTLIVLTSDHGDGFMEHGFISHSTTPYDELSRVPLLIKLPDQAEAGRVVNEQVRLIDLMPTLLEELGARPPRGIAGCALQGLWQKTPEGEDPRPLPCRDALTEIAETGGYPTISVRTRDAKVIHFENRDDEYYALSQDPGERTNLGDPTDPEGQRLRQLALAVVSQRPDATETIELDEAQIRELKALGYIH